jgi:hypothetical protein
MAFHFATLPVTQIVSVTVAAVASGMVLAAGGSRTKAGLVFVGILGAFQLMPVSPGSLCRGLFTCFLVLRQKDFRDYMVALPLSFLKYIGYLAFPIQMAASYPELARFMASRWATKAVHIVPVFGEKGALLEHSVFDLFFNRPRIAGIWMRRRVRFLADVWLLAGLGLLTALAGWLGRNWSSPAGVNVILAVTVVFVLPRVLFLPVIMRRNRTKYTVS